MAPSVRMGIFFLPGGGGRFWFHGLASMFYTAFTLNDGSVFALQADILARVQMTGLSLASYQLLGRCYSADSIKIIDFITMPHSFSLYWPPLVGPVCAYGCSLLLGLWLGHHHV